MCTLQVVGLKSEVLCTEETQGMMMERCTTNGVDRLCLDDVVQSKHIEIHKVCCGNKWMGSLDLSFLNKTTSQTADWGLKMIQ